MDGTESPVKSENSLGAWSSTTKAGKCRLTGGTWIACAMLAFLVGGCPSPKVVDLQEAKEFPKEVLNVKGPVMMNFFQSRMRHVHCDGPRHERTGRRI